MRTYNGDFSSNLPIKTVGERAARTARDLTRSADGGAEVELESFGGTIRLRRPGTVTRPRACGTRSKHND